MQDTPRSSAAWPEPVFGRHKHYRSTKASLYRELFVVGWNALFSVCAVRQLLQALGNGANIAVA